MSTLKRISAAILFFFMIFNTPFIVASCGNGKNKSKIIIVSEETFKSEVKLTKYGYIEEKFSPKKLSRSEVEYLEAGKKYYALIYLHKIKFWQGKIEISSGAKTDITFDSGNDMFGADKTLSIYFNDNKDGYVLKNSSKKITGDTHYAAFGFTLNSFDGLENYGLDELNIKLSYSAEKDVETYDKEIAVTKELRHEKQLNVSSSTLKYFTESDYQSGKYDDKLKDSLEIARGEKFYVVADYTVSGGVKIEDADTATAIISVSGKDISLNVAVEELPTSDYSITGGTVKATVKVYNSTSDSKTFRFVIAVTAESYVNTLDINVKSTFSSGNISVKGAKQLVDTVKINPELTIVSKLSYELSPNGQYYSVTGIGDETSSYIAIPDTYNGLPVMQIADDAFLNLKHIKEINLPETLTTIGKNAFKGCTGIKRIFISKNVINVGANAFGELTDIEIFCEHSSPPSGWSTSFASQNEAYITWNYCDRQYILNEDGSSYSYYYGTNGINIVIPETYKGLPVTAISEQSFLNALHVKKIKIPKTVVTIPTGVFDKCRALEEFVVSEENPSYRSEGKRLIDVKSNTIVFGE